MHRYRVLGGAAVSGTGTQLDVLLLAMHFYILLKLRGTFILFGKYCSRIELMVILLNTILNILTPCHLLLGESYQPSFCSQDTILLHSNKVIRIDKDLGLRLNYAEALSCGHHTQPAASQYFSSIYSIFIWWY